MRVLFQPNDVFIHPVFVFFSSKCTIYGVKYIEIKV